MIARQIVESAIWSKPPLYLKVWVYLLARAQHSDYKKLKRGQLSTSIPEIRDAVSWKVGFRIEKPSKDQIFNILNWLRNPDEGGNEYNGGDDMIKTTKATQSMLVTITNYSIYQDPESYGYNGNQTTGTTAKKLRVQRHPDNINKNVKNDNNKTSLSSKDDTSKSVDFQKFISWFNKQTGKNFKNVESNRKIIRARINEGYSKADLAKVVEFKSKQWKKDPQMNKYLRITTLFAPSHFGNYLEETNNTSQHYQPVSTSGQTAEDVAKHAKDNLARAEERARKALNNE